MNRSVSVAGRLAVGGVATALALLMSAAPASAAPKDSDRDGIPNSWETKYKLNPRSAADAKKDLDGDGLNNLAEYRYRALPRDEDTDNDGQDDGDERRTKTSVRDADSDNDGVRDGDEDYDRDGIANEDEDDATESCALDDDDADRDGIANEDENELGLHNGRADSDRDGVPDGAEDRNGDGVANEDEDDDDTDRCFRDGDGDGIANEDEQDRLGVVASFDQETGALVIETDAGERLEYTVDADTEIELKDVEGQENESEGTAADIVAGTVVAEVDVDRKSGALEELELYRPAVL